MFYATRYQVYWGLTHNVTFLLVLWFDITHTNNKHTHIQRHTAPSEANRLTHPYKFIFASLVMCSQQLSLLHWINNSLISKIYIAQCLFFSKYNSLVKVIYLLIRCYKTRFFLWNKNSTDIIGINKQNIHTPHTHQTLRERLHWKGFVSMKISNTLPFLKQPPLFYQPLQFCGKNLKNLNNPFMENFKNSTLNPPLYKGGGWVGGWGGPTR